LAQIALVALTPLGQRIGSAYSSLLLLQSQSDGQLQLSFVSGKKRSEALVAAAALADERDRVDFLFAVILFPARKRMRLPWSPRFPLLVIGKIRVCPFHCLIPEFIFGKINPVLSLY